MTDETNRGGARAGSGRKRLFTARLAPSPIRAEVDEAITAIAERPEFGSKADVVRALLDWGLWADRAMLQIGEGIAPLVQNEGEPVAVDVVTDSAGNVIGIAEKQTVAALKRLLAETSEVLAQSIKDPELLGSEIVAALRRRIGEALK